jgi:hypothetical protein
MRVSELHLRLWTKGTCIQYYDASRDKHTRGGFLSAYSLLKHAVPRCCRIYLSNSLVSTVVASN